MQLKLSDVLGQAFVARPLEDCADEDGSVKVSIANMFGNTDQEPEVVQLHCPDPPVVKQDSPKVTTGKVIPPWELAAQVIPLEMGVELPAGASQVEDETTQTQAVTVPWEKNKGIDIVDRGLPEGWGADHTERLLEHNGHRFKCQQDADDWVIAKGRALPFSNKDETRPDPFDVDSMYRQVEACIESPLIQHRVSTFRAACRHAIALSIVYYEQDVERYESARKAEQEALAIDEAEAARIRWKQAVENRRVQLVALDKEVADARDAWHALRK